MTNRHIFAALAAAALLAATPLEARELRIGSGAPPAHPANSHLYTRLQTYLPEESEGRLTAQLMGPEVVSLGQMKEALQSQLVEVGNLLPLYFPADLPNMALAGELALVGRNPQAMAAAMTEYMVTCDSCRDEMKRFGVVFLGSGSSDVYRLLTTKPVRSAADLKGLRLRSGGAPFSRWAEHFGAVPVNVQVGETFESMSQGVIDGTMASIADLLSFRLVELVSSVTDLELGTYHATSNFAVGAAAWQSLDVADRTALARAANRANADFTHRWAAEMPAESTAAAEKAGIEFIEPDAALVEASDQFARDDIDAIAASAKERFAFDDAEDRIARFLGLVDKWTAKVEAAGSDPAAIASDVQAEIWDKVDFSSYGL